MSRKMKINTTPVASRYADPGETIIEFTFPSGKGGLISFGETSNRVEVYRTDPGVTVARNPADKILEALYEAVEKGGMKPPPALRDLMIEAGVMWVCQGLNFGNPCGHMYRSTTTECSHCGVCKTCNPTTSA